MEDNKFNLEITMDDIIRTNQILLITEQLARKYGLTKDEVMFLVIDLQDSKKHPDIEKLVHANEEEQKELINYTRETLKKLKFNDK